MFANWSHENAQFKSMSPDERTAFLLFRTRSYADDRIGVIKVSRVVDRYRVVLQVLQQGRPNFYALLLEDILLYENAQTIADQLNEARKGSND